MVWVAVVVGVIFFGTVFFGAPYVPTRTPQVKQAMLLFDNVRGQEIVELGAGTGGVSLALLDAGARVTAYEINPLLCLVLWLRTRRYSDSMTIRWGNFWSANMSKYDGVYVFLASKFMGRLEEKLGQELRQGARLVSYAFELPGQKPTKTVGPMHLYEF